MPELKYPKMLDLDFGRLSASEEARTSPALLTEGYFDFQKASYRVATGDAWAIVGSKGAGKSAAFEHLDLLWRGNPEKFLVRWELGSFPVADITTLQVGTSPGPTSSKAAWEFLILLRAFESLMRDNGASYDSEIIRLRKELTAAGLIEGEDLKTRFFDWSKSTAKFNVLGVGAEGSSSDSGATALQISAIVKRAISTIRTSSQHVLAVDGLDSFFAQSDRQQESLAALVDATFEINAFLARTELRCSVVIAIRSDMLAQVPSTDSAKMSDHAVELNWSRGGSGDGNELWDLINQKARISVLPSFAGRPLKDVRSAYLQNAIQIGAYESIPSYFLSHTRFLPRDMIALMNELKELHVRTGPVPESTAKEAVRLYCDSYFVREISNGLSRVLPGSSATKVLAFTEALSALQSRYFRASQLEDALSDVLDAGDLRILLRQLYLVGGIGVQSTVGGSKHTNFVYRRASGGGFSYIAEFTLHNSLVIAWNLHW